MQLARQKYLYGIKIVKNQIPWNNVITLADKLCKNSWRHVKLFSIERNHWTLFRNISASMPDKIQQEFISKVGNAFIFYHIVVQNVINMLIFKNSIWWLFRARTLRYGISVMDLTVNFSQWKNMFIFCIIIYILILS